MHSMVPNFRQYSESFRKPTMSCRHPLGLQPALSPRAPGSTCLLRRSPRRFPPRLCSGFGPRRGVTGNGGGAPTSARTEQRRPESADATTCCRRNRKHGDGKRTLVPRLSITPARPAFPFNAPSKHRFLLAMVAIIWIRIVLQIQVPDSGTPLIHN